jgi:L-alanine-DL-glutamate epimerase-like enolase superfamily enzyme
VTGETLESAQAFFARHQASLVAGVADLDSLGAWMSAHPGAIDASPAAWCAIELAILDLLAKEAGRTVEALLALPPLAGRFQYTAVLGDMPADAFEATAARYRKMGFTDFKVKLSGRAEHDRSKVDVLRQWDGIRVRVDANNLWTDVDEAARFLQRLDYPFFAVEEPIGAHRYAQLVRLWRILGCRIVLDESFLRISQLGQLADHPDCWLVNLRVSKMGGLIRSLAIVAAARAAGIGLIVGAQVGETSLLTRVGLTVAHAARDTLVGQEGAFGTFLLERDVCEPPLMFGPGGVLEVADYPLLERPGLGVC